MSIILSYRYDKLMAVEEEMKPDKSLEGDLSRFKEVLVCYVTVKRTGSSILGNYSRPITFPNR